MNAWLFVLRGHWPFVLAWVLAVSGLMPLASPAAAGRVGADAAPSSRFVEWPQSWDGVPIRPLAMTDIERRFSVRFPGAIARFTDGASRVFVMRHVTQPTRMLHPAVDCFRATGYRIQATRLERDSSSRLWRCFEAEREGERVRVCERIEGPQGEAFTDASSWFWAASFGSSVGPWKAVTVVEAL